VFQHGVSNPKANCLQPLLLRVFLSEPAGERILLWGPDHHRNLIRSGPLQLPAAGDHELLGRQYHLRNEFGLDACRCFSDYIS